MIRKSELKKLILESIQELKEESAEVKTIAEMTLGNVLVSVQEDEDGKFVNVSKDDDHSSVYVIDANELKAFINENV
jgi:predicted transcriptional regulator